MTNRKNKYLFFFQYIFVLHILLIIFFLCFIKIFFVDAVRAITTTKSDNNVDYDEEEEVDIVLQSTTERLLRRFQDEPVEERLANVNKWLRDISASSASSAASFEIRQTSTGQGFGVFATKSAEKPSFIFPLNATFQYKSLCGALTELDGENTQEDENEENLNFVTKCGSEESCSSQGNDKKHQQPKQLNVKAHRSHIICPVVDLIIHRIFFDAPQPDGPEHQQQKSFSAPAPRRLFEVSATSHLARFELMHLGLATVLLKFVPKKIFQDANDTRALFFHPFIDSFSLDSFCPLCSFGFDDLDIFSQSADLITQRRQDLEEFNWIRQVLLHEQQKLLIQSSLKNNNNNNNQILEQSLDVALKYFDSYEKYQWGQCTLVSRLMSTDSVSAQVPYVVHTNHNLAKFPPSFNTVVEKPKSTSSCVNGDDNSNNNNSCVDYEKKSEPTFVSQYDHHHRLVAPVSVEYTKLLQPLNHSKIMNLSFDFEFFISPDQELIESYFSRNVPLSLRFIQYGIVEDQRKFRSDMTLFRQRYIDGQLSRAKNVDESLIKNFDRRFHEEVTCALVEVPLSPWYLRKEIAKLKTNKNNNNNNNKHDNEKNDGDDEVLIQLSEQLEISEKYWNPCLDMIFFFLKVVHARTILQADFRVRRRIQRRRSGKYEEDNNNIEYYFDYYQPADEFNDYGRVSFGSVCLTASQFTDLIPLVAAIGAYKTTCKAPTWGDWNDIVKIAQDYNETRHKKQNDKSNDNHGDVATDKMSDLAVLRILNVTGRHLSIFSEEKNLENLFPFDSQNQSTSSDDVANDLNELLLSKPRQQEYVNFKFRFKGNQNVDREQQELLSAARYVSEVFVHPQFVKVAEYFEEIEALRETKKKNITSGKQRLPPSLDLIASWTEIQLFLLDHLKKKLEIILK